MVSLVSRVSVRSWIDVSMASQSSFSTSLLAASRSRNILLFLLGLAATRDLEKDD